MPEGKRKRRRSDERRHLSSLFDLPELFLRVLSFLSPADLAAAQGVNHYWQRMVLDPQLWKRLYLERYNHPHRAHILPGDSTPRRRPIARLPSRSFPPPSPSPSPGPEEEIPIVRHDGVDWKLMLRVGTNWSNGNVRAQASIPLPSSPVSGSQAEVAESATSQQFLALFPSFVAASSPNSPLVHIYTPSGESLGIVPPPQGWSSPSRPDNVSAVVADQAVTLAEEGYVPARLGIFYTSGGFVIVRLRIDPTGRLVWAREHVSHTRSRPARLRRRNGTDPVVLAAMYYPFLVTCTTSFQVGVYTLTGSSEPMLVRSLHSDVSFHPAQLSLAPTTAGHYRASLTFSTPVYPSSWTVAVQELEITKTSTGASVRRGEHHHVHTPSWGSWPRKLQPIPGVRGRALGVGSDGRWCVLAGEDNVIHVYALPAERKKDEGDGITHAQTLLAPKSGVGAISISAGRCVSGGGGTDGRLLVWELDAGESTDGEARVGMQAGYVEVKSGGRRRVHTPPTPTPAPKASDDDWHLPHPSSISSAARSLFLAPPPASLPPSATAPTHAPGGIRHLAFDEEKIVALGSGDIMRIWSFR